MTIEKTNADLRRELEIAELQAEFKGKELGYLYMNVREANKYNVGSKQEWLMYMYPYMYYDALDAYRRPLKLPNRRYARRYRDLNQTSNEQ